MGLHVGCFLCHFLNPTVFSSLVIGTVAPSPKHTSGVRHQHENPRPPPHAICVPTTASSSERRETAPGSSGSSARQAAEKSECAISFSWRSANNPRAETRRTYCVYTPLNAPSSSLPPSSFLRVGPADLSGLVLVSTPAWLLPRSGLRNATEMMARTFFGPCEMKI